jgi:hypothetical protein
MQLYYLPFHDDLRNLPDVAFANSSETEVELAKKVIQ